MRLIDMYKNFSDHCKYYLNPVIYLNRQDLEDIKRWDEYKKAVEDENKRFGWEDTHIEPSDEIKTKNKSVSVACSG